MFSEPQIKAMGSSGSDRVHDHLQTLAQDGDRVLQMVRLEANYSDRLRYLAIVQNRQMGHVVMGMDATPDPDVNPTLGFVLRMLPDTEVKLDGDGGFSVFQNFSGGDLRHFIFKPVSVQALWTVIQTLHMIKERLSNPAANNDQWINHYESMIDSSQSCINEWHEMADLLVKRPPSPSLQGDSTAMKGSNREITIKSKLRCIMKTVDLDTITSKVIRNRLEEEIGETLESFKSFIDEEILLILGQMDPASKIIDYLFLGSEWNASNLDELRSNGITHVLNVTREIDNFFPASFSYRNIRVYDEEATDLLRHFDSTYKFIRDAKAKGGKVLVHCKMGISRSASVVISYLMKEYVMDLEQALIRTKECRSIVNPNKSFIKQLEVYEGMLSAIRNRLTYYGKITRSKSESSLVQSCSSGGSGMEDLKDGTKIGLLLDVPRHKPRRSQSSRVADHCKDVDVKALSRAYTRSVNSKEFKRAVSSSEPISTGSCKCLDTVLSHTEPGSAFAVNAEAGFDPHCGCDVEVELNVPEKPVEMKEEDEDTNAVVGNLANVPIMIRSHCVRSRKKATSLQDSSLSSLSSSSAASSPTLSLSGRTVSLRRRRSAASDSRVVGSVVSSDKAGSSTSLPTIVQEEAINQNCDKRNNPDTKDVLSVKTLANMYDFRINTGTIKFCTNLEENKMFQKAKDLNDSNEKNVILAATKTETEC